MSTECSQNSRGRSIRVSGVVSFRASTPAPVLEAPMKEIQLTQGKVALVDDEDYEELSKYRWCVTKKQHTCYAYRQIGKAPHRKIVQMHRHIIDQQRSVILRRLYLHQNAIIGLQLKILYISGF